MSDAEFVPPDSDEVTVGLLASKLLSSVSVRPATNVDLWVHSLRHSQQIGPGSNFTSSLSPSLNQNKALRFVSLLKINFSRSIAFSYY